MCVDEILYHPMADGTKGLKVLEGTLSSSSVHGVNVVHLPEMSFNRTLNHFIQLQHANTDNVRQIKYIFKYPLMTDTIQMITSNRYAEPILCIDLLLFRTTKTV